MALEIIHDRLFKSRHAPECSASDALGRDLPEEPLDQVQPRSTRGREVHVVTRPAGEPALNPRRLVRTVVIHHQMDLGLGLARLLVNELQELEEFLMPVPPVATAHDFPSRHVQGGKQRGGPMALIVVRAPLALSGQHGQQRLGAIQGLDLRLLVHTQHDRVLRRIAYTVRQYRGSSR